MGKGAGVRARPTLFIEILLTNQTPPLVVRILSEMVAARASHALFRNAEKAVRISLPWLSS